MNNRIDQAEVGVATPANPATSGSVRWVGKGVAAAVIVAVAATAAHMHWSSAAPVVAPPPPSVAISAPLQRDIEGRLGFLGQFSAVNRVELRAQVGGTLTQINFKDGDVVHRGDVLFEIDPEPYQIKLSQATAGLESANARLALATREFARAQELQRSEAGTAENVDQKVAEQRAAQAAVDNANALVRDARFDLDRCKITAPFTGRIGTHLVSTGNLISGSRAGSGPTTLLATIVSLDPIYLDFDISENDYAAFQHSRENRKGPLADAVTISPTGDSGYARTGTLNFIDNTLDRSSGTIHARATIPNSDLSLTPGGFARLRLATTAPQPALLVPDAAVLQDQTDHMVYVVGEDNVATPRKVEVGDLRGGLRVIRSGLAVTDRIVIDGIPAVRPGSKISPHAGTIQFSAEHGDEGAQS
ncbi:MexE family multidrug efflux RND transporter periplasmic adaptor subunit [Paraburkholderia terrae]|uniref:MexE family multidrug efflux RND transporter periplasmic adaptor subunit n=1 Tax=Paraburkholderia terrae TaxID=311230 RepID=A0ABM7U8Y9_9BURK|nr:efflux RND transporter periplasmic adaptor subunit [Paraburkholderia terrae]BCZ83715.1 MexE family multidrug efflux RND transporter periplasmic adaptor subunit [Paraburkholderia terrae]